MKTKYVPVALRTKYNRVEILLALAWFLGNYHSGQWSKGYRYLSITLRKLREEGILYALDRSLSRREARLYRYFVRNYKNKV
jgi:hypothetical protein